MARKWTTEEKKRVFIGRWIATREAKVTIPKAPWEKKKLTPFHKRELEWLTTRLHEAQNEAWSRNPKQEARNELELRHQELRSFKKKLIDEGYNI